MPTCAWMSCFCPEIRKEKWFHKKDCTFIMIGIPVRTSQIAKGCAAQLHHRRGSQDMPWIYWSGPILAGWKAKKTRLSKNPVIEWGSSEATTTVYQDPETRWSEPRFRLYRCVQVSCFHGVPKCLLGDVLLFGRSQSRYGKLILIQRLPWWLLRNHHCNAYSNSLELSKPWHLCLVKETFQLP